MNKPIWYNQTITHKNWKLIKAHWKKGEMAFTRLPEPLFEPTQDRLGYVMREHYRPMMAVSRNPLYVNTLAA